MALQQTDRGQHHAWRANAALRSAAFNEGLLHGVESIAVGNSFDGDDLDTVSLHERHETAVDQLAVEQNRTGAALSLPAPFLRSCEAQPGAQRVQQPHHRMPADLDVGAVDPTADRDA